MMIGVYDSTNHKIFSTDCMNESNITYVLFLCQITIKVRYKVKNQHLRNKSIHTINIFFFRFRTFSI